MSCLTARAVVVPAVLPIKYFLPQKFVEIEDKSRALHRDNNFSVAVPKNQTLILLGLK